MFSSNGMPEERTHTYPGRKRGPKPGACRRPPYGWQRTGVGEQIERSPIEWPVVQLIKSLAREGKCSPEISEILTAKGIRNRKGGTFHHGQVRRVLKREGEKQEQAA